MDSGIERVEQMLEARRGRGTPPRRRAPRRLLRGCLIGCGAVLLILTLGWWYASRHLGQLISGIVRKQAAENMNGRIEFSKLDVDLAGRAVFTDIEVYGPQDGKASAPLIKAPKLAAALDFFTLFGPNRGKRAVAITIDDAEAKIVREADGKFDVARLFKEPKKKREPWGIAITLRNAKIDFTDLSLLDQAYPQLSEPDGSLARRLLDELGYKQAGHGESSIFHELLGVDGSVALNGERKELGLKLSAQRPGTGGKLSVDGSASQDGSAVDLTLDIDQLDLATTAAYGHALFPKLALLPAGAAWPQKPPQPALAGEVKQGSIHFVKVPKAEPQISVNAELADTHYASKLLPDIDLPRLKADYEDKKSLGLDLELHSLGSTLSGKPSLRWDDKDPTLIHLDGRVNVEATDLAALASQSQKLLSPKGVPLKLAGSGKLQLDLGGTTREPDLGFNLDGQKLQYQNYKAGSLSARGRYSGPPGLPDLNFDLSAGQLDLLGVRLEQLKSQGDYKGPPGSASGKASLSSSAITYGDLKLGKLSAQLSIDKGVATLSKAALSGGEAPLKASGHLNLKTKDGDVQASVGPLEFADLLALGDKAQKLAPGSKGKTTANKPAQLKDISGKVTASADAKILRGKLKGNLGLSSEKLLVAGNTFKSVDVKGGIEANSIRIDSAEAQISTKDAIDLAGFSSTGPLTLKARAGGTISLPPHSSGAGPQKPMTLALSGKANTTNLKPEQANIAFKLAGPASGAELKLQLKTTEAQNPLALSGTLSLKSGLAPAKASLSWHDMTVNYDGKLDLKAQKLDGKLSAKDVDLARMLKGSALSGKLSATAQLGGSFSAPDLAGKLSSSKLSFAAEQRSYDVTSLSAGFKLNSTAKGKDKNGKALTPEMQLSVSDGSFDFEGMPFTAKGVLGKAGSQLTLACSSFNLFSALSLWPDKAGSKKPQIKASGPLTVALSGTPAEPKAVVSYSSGAGSVEGHSFSSASLSATATKTRLSLSSFTVESQEGSIEASGEATYTLPDLGKSGGGKSSTKPGKAQQADATEVHKSGGAPAQAPPKKQVPAREVPADDAAPHNEHEEGDSTSVGALFGIRPAYAQGGKARSGFKLSSYSANVTIDNFDVGVVTPLTGQNALAELSGRASGSFKLQGAGKQVDGSGSLTLKNGKFHGIPIQQATAKLRSKRLADGRLQLLIEDGSVTSDKTRLSLQGQIGPEAADSSLSVDAESLDLGLLAPFIKEGNPKPTGVMTGSLNLSPGKGAYPNLSVDIRDNGSGVRIGDKVKFSGVALSAGMKNDLLTVQNLKISSAGSSLSAGGSLSPSVLSQAAQPSSNLPLDFWLKSDKFNFADALALAGPLLKPEQLKLVPDGSISADLTLGGNVKKPQLSGTASFDLSHLPGEMPVTVTGLSGKVTLTNNAFELTNVRMATGSDPALSAASITGSGSFSFAAPFLKSGDISIDLSPGGKFIPFELKDSFSGTLGGTVIIKAVAAGGRKASGLSSEYQLVVSGGVIVTQGGTKSTYMYNPPPKGQQKAVNRNLRFSKFEVNLLNGTEFRFTPPNAAQKLALSDMTLSLQTPRGDGETGKNQGGVQKQGRALVLNGVPGVLDKNDPDAFSIKGDVDIPSGTLLIYKYKVKMDGLKNLLHFTGLPGDIYPEFTGRGKLTLPRVLKGYDAGINLPGSDSIPVQQRPSGGRNDDLTIYFNFDRVKLEPGNAGLGKFTLTSEPPMAAEKIQGYLLGGITDVLTGDTALGDFAEGELISFGSSFISRQIERSFDLESFNIGGTGSEGNPYYVDVEKAVSPNVSLTYYRNFFSQTSQQEEFGVRYKIFQEQFGDKYRGLQLNVNFNESGMTGSGTTVQFEYTVKF